MTPFLQGRVLHTALLLAGIGLGLPLAAQEVFAPPTVAIDSNGAASHERPEQPEGWDSELALTVAEDLNPDPNILEIELEARITDMEILPGKITPVWTYNGGLPGPLIRATVGDRLIVHFTNSLPEETTVHWHGLRVPNDQDGVPGITMPHLMPGDQFTYDFVLTEPGNFWYHPHHNSAAQVGYGLYGPLIVDEPGEDQNRFGDELILMLSDMSLNSEGQFLPADSGGGFGDLFGREGEVLLVNGKVMPDLKVRQGLQQRWRIINAARTRYYTLRYKREPFTVLGGDNGLASRSTEVDQVLITPSERKDIVFTPSDAPGTTTEFKWYPTNRGYGTTFNRFSAAMMTLTTVDAPAVEPRPIPEELRDIAPVDVSDAVEHDIELTIAIDGAGDVEMGINGIPFWSAKPLMATAGETHLWTVKNNSDFDHPFHLHGFYFQVLDDSGIVEWKDTVNVPVNSEVKIAIPFDERPGMWMFHCHILDHAEVGMMGHLQLNPADGSELQLPDYGGHHVSGEPAHHRR